MIQACRNSDSQASVLGFLIECYSHKGLFLEGLEVFRETRVHGYVPTIRTCNALLGVLQRKGEPELAWCFYGAVVRNGVSPDQFTWSIIARILGKNRNLERIARMVDMGMYNSVLYNVLIDGYCKRGEFKAALDHLNEMCNRKLNPGFSTYSSILDGACKYGDIEVIEMIRGSMVEKKFIPNSLLSEYDSIIQKFCDLGKTYAAEMFIRRAWEDEKVRLEDATYGCMLRALSRGGRVKEAIELHGVILERGIAVNDSSCYAFVNVLCNEDPSVEVSELLRDMIGRGFSPHAADLSKFITSQCDKRRWREAEDLLNIILEKGFLPDSFCCCSLVEHYCSSGRIDSAIALHDKMEKLKGGLDVTTYNVLLNGLFAKRRVEEAVRLFDYMRAQNLVSSESFSIMVRGLCRAKELRKALRIHDEMMELGLKPERAKYKRLISGFKY
ncbi:hypothetical protein L1049_010173 [Liquidambar formosana]|uniref:Pentatricopeptide repeat-containing protein n=1 Tax=Liquidambar formosana TaxID=63359 RepID=A0AAP0N9S3_LIQFO